MRKQYLTLCLYLLLALPSIVTASSVVDIQTNRGTFTVELNPTEAPVTVANFLAYVGLGFYDNTQFHRVIDGFVIQGGGIDINFNKKETFLPIVLESNNGLQNKRGTIAMARTSVPDSATSQFFINTVDNDGLNYQSAENPGYAVFGSVTEGMNVVDAISSVKTVSGTAADGTFYESVPEELVIIQTIRPREGELSFKELQSSYAVGDVINLSLEEAGLKRENTLDLWVAIIMPNGQVLYMTEEGSDFFTTTPTAFKRAVGVETTSHQILNFTVPEGLAGHYTFVAIFNKLNAGVEDLGHTARSNIASSGTDFIE